MTIEEIKLALKQIMDEINEHESTGAKMGMAWSYVYSAVKALDEVQLVSVVDASEYIKKLEKERDLLKQRARLKRDD